MVSGSKLRLGATSRGVAGIALALCAALAGGVLYGATLTGAEAESQIERVPLTTAGLSTSEVLDRASEAADLEIPSLRGIPGELQVTEATVTLAPEPVRSSAIAGSR